mmetsp:Transcript_18027/g.42132  ORF Transcript_18027/g.42132 Transcript_18027/m.42132 type:complete len:430 (+) Transcript_18027:83-1372(+)
MSIESSRTSPLSSSFNIGPWPSNSFTDVAVHLNRTVSGVWMPDTSACQLCDAAFGMFGLKVRLRHHCRVCGRCVCAECSPTFAKLTGFNAVQRVCTPCISGTEIAAAMQARLETFSQALNELAYGQDGAALPQRIVSGEVGASSFHRAWGSCEQSLATLQQVLQGQRDSNARAGRAEARVASERQITQKALEEAQLVREAHAELKTRLKALHNDVSELEDGICSLAHLHMHPGTPGSERSFEDMLERCRAAVIALEESQTTGTPASCSEVRSSCTPVAEDDREESFGEDTNSSQQTTTSSRLMGSIEKRVKSRIDAKQCCLCHGALGLAGGSLWRSHECRICHRCVCLNCAKSSLSLPDSMRHQRACDECVAQALTMPDVRRRLSDLGRSLHLLAAKQAGAAPPSGASLEEVTSFCEQACLTRQEHIVK